MFDPNDLARWAHGEWKGILNAPLRGFHFDTRSLQKGQIFVAIKTDKQDGHNYLSDALNKGAVAALVGRYDENIPMAQLVVKDTVCSFQAIAKEYRKTLALPIIGITGSFGKTSTKDTLHTLLGKDKTHKTEHTFNNTLGVPYTLTQIDPGQHRYAVVEAGINMPGEMDVLADMIRPDIGVVTLIAGQHLQYLGSEENIAREKAKLVGAMDMKGRLYAHYSCMFFDDFKKFSKPVRILMPQGEASGFGAYEDIVEYRMERISKTQIRVTLFGKHFPEASVVMPMVSRGMVSNLCLAALVALDLGVSIERIRQELYNWMPSNIRGQLLARAGQTFYVDTYNSGVLSMKNSLDYFNELFFKNTERLFVIAAMHELGNQSDRFHYDLGREIDYRDGDRFVIINQKAKPLAQGLIDQGVNPSKVAWIEDAQEAKAYVEAFDGPIFLKGSKPYRLHELVPQGASLVNLNEI